MRLDQQDIAYAEKAEEEHMASEFYHLFFRRMTAIDMDIACVIYNSLLREENIVPPNNWFRNLNT